VSQDPAVVGPATQLAPWSEADDRRQAKTKSEEFVRERKQPVPKREVLAENRAVWEQFCKQLRLGAGGLG
jgi:hypothetical protein